MAIVEWLSSCLAEQGVRGGGGVWKMGLTSWISEIGHFLLPSQDMTERLLKRHKSSKQPYTTSPLSRSQGH